MSPKPSRMTGYVRVSRIAGREGDSFISPDEQRKQIGAWAAMRSVQIVAWYEDLDVSGNDRQRPGLDAFLADLKGGATEGIVVNRLDRLSRLGVGDALALVEEIHDLGGQIAAIDLGIDPMTTFGEFAMTIMLGMARMERRRICESWEIAKERAIERGVKIGPTPFGYRKVSGHLEIDPVYGPIVAEAFKRGTDALPYLQQQDKGTWTTFTVRRMLANRSYLGETRYGELVNLDAHPPLVSRAVFEAAQSEVSNRRRPKATFPLSGLATCKQCGHPLIGARGGNDARRMYRCSAALKTFKGERCSLPTTVTAQLLEDLVTEAAIEALSGHQGFIAMDDEGNGLGEAEDALRSAERELEDLLADAALRSTLGAERFRKLAQTMVAAVDDARLLYREALSRSDQVDKMPTSDLLKDAELHELGDLLRGMLDNIIVTRGRTPLADRVRIVPHVPA